MKLPRLRMRVGTLMLLVVIVALALGLIERQRQLEHFRRARALLLEVQSVERAEYREVVRRLESTQTRLAAYKRREKFERSVAGLPAEEAAVARQRFEKAEQVSADLYRGMTAQHAPSRPGTSETAASP